MKFVWLLTAQVFAAQKKLVPGAKTWWDTDIPIDVFVDIADDIEHSN